jgi:hypothetical protein
MDPKMTLTETARKSGVTFTVEDGMGSSSSNSRRIPYVEWYGQMSGLYETPIQHLQRAADDEVGRS